MIVTIKIDKGEPVVDMYLGLSKVLDRMHTELLNKIRVHSIGGNVLMCIQDLPMDIHTRRYLLSFRLFWEHEVNMYWFMLECIKEKP